MNLVDEENGLPLRAQRLDDGFEALFEIAAEPGAGKERTGVECIDFRAFQRLLDIGGH